MINPLRSTTFRVLLCCIFSEAGMVGGVSPRESDCFCHLSNNLRLGIVLILSMEQLTSQPELIPKH